jgi:hypothetical protein
MDPSMLIDLAVSAVAANPKSAGFLALVPVVQGIGWLLGRFLPAHTIAARWGRAVAAFPVRVPQPVKAPGAP